MLLLMWMVAKKHDQGKFRVPAIITRLLGEEYKNGLR